MRRSSHRLAAAACLASLALSACCSVKESPTGDDRAEPAPTLAPRSVVADIVSWNAQLGADDRAAKYCKMAASAFAFFRGTNHLFWADLGSDPRLLRFGNAKTRTWIQGDLHVYNFGAFDSDTGAIVYSLNDFDEALVADYQYDLWRMATSLVLSARANPRVPASAAGDIVDTFTESYLDTMARYRGNNDERGKTFTRSNTRGRLDNFLDDVAAANSRKRALDRWTTLSDQGRRTFAFSPRKLEPTTAAEDRALRAAMRDYRGTLPARLRDNAAYFRVKSTARRLGAGTGSLGTSRFYVLVEGPSENNADDRILDVKRQNQPTAYEYVDDSTRAAYDAVFSNHAVRHAIAQRALLADADDHLGWMKLPDGDYSVRERSVFKKSLPAEQLPDSEAVIIVAEQWGTILATTHARSDKDFDPRFVPHSVDKHIDATTDHHHREVRALVREVALSYADTVERDYAEFLATLAPAICP